MVNGQSLIVNRQSSIVNGQSSIVADHTQMTHERVGFTIDLELLYDASFFLQPLAFSLFFFSSSFFPLLFSFF
ncbi:hypothetical protein H6G89_28600 [Oscillatoria sp. FACHB-1407]|uniref:hypothetical protein n=1 Tax=Oscillatoria sp. FACHB-1407 TaxID=2692847 RepID=UPI0016866E25|nr:hypothetical protein [Oscillatoria sp. FACHB-1407]MBD2464969.1 hypothetical protein [Oscillatoria sp. FACHB-1407]